MNKATAFVVWFGIWAWGTGCDSDPSPKLGGYPVTTPLGFHVFWLGPSYRYPTLEMAVEEIDSLAAKHYAGKLPELRLIPIQLIPSQGVHGGYAAYTWYGVQIDVALDAEGYDQWTSTTYIGLEWLIHEWKHVLEGDWHP